MNATLFIIACAGLFTAVEEAPALYFVREGEPAAVRYAAREWTRGDGYLEFKGEMKGDLLFADRWLGSGNFHLHARLALMNVEGTAASFVINDRSHFGFDGDGKQLFVEGRLFGDKTAHIEGTAGLIQPGQPFDFDVIREGAQLRFQIAGRDVHTIEYSGRDLGIVAFRPWRSTMRIYDFWVRAAETAPFPMRTQPTSYSIPTLDMAFETWRQVIVESIPGQYLGHPTTVLMPDNKTIFVTYPLGHGGPSAVLKKSTDGGLTWSERLPVPDNWATATNCPCIHRLVDPHGVARLFVFEGNGQMRQACSEDGGETWTPFEPNGLHCVVAPITIVPIRGNRLLMHYHRGFSEQDRSPLTIWQSISEDGGLTWAPERKVGEKLGADPCEPAIIRSPDGTQLASIMRENSRRYNSLLMTSNDEGETWTELVEAPASLTGDRHMPRYAPDGRLVMTFRDTAADSPTRGDFVAWVGTYDDMVNLREGQYRVRLLAPPKKFDLGYPGLELLPDGTFVTTTYAELVAGQKNSVISVRFTMDDIDKKGAVTLDEQAVYVGGQEGYHTYRIPAVLVTQQGAVLAFCEGRKNSGADDGDIDLMLRRSTDSGKTWGPMQKIWDDGEHTIGNPAPVQDRANGVIWLPFCRDNDRVFVTHSTDDGLTWAEPAEITKQVKPVGWAWYATGPVHAVQLKSGRLLIPCNHSLAGDENQYSHVIVSDDHGETWKLGGTLLAKTDECTAVELQDGRVYLNMRSYHGNYRRAIAWSGDGGETWSDVQFDQTLVEPVCQGSACRLSTTDNGGKHRILFSNPANPERVQMTVRVSYDEAQTWAAGQCVHWGPSAYSDLCVLPDGAIGLLYEKGRKDAYETITFARIPFDWLTGWTDQRTAAGK